MADSLQQQFGNIWKKQSRTQQMVLIFLVVVVAVLVGLFVTWSSTPDYAVAFTGMNEEDAGQIVEKLTEENVSYQLRDSGTILVPSNQVYEVRLKMARAGLPQSSTVGFELFSENTFGMTEFTQRVNYQRALEGELARTISSLDAVEDVKVHLVTPEKSLLSEQQQPTTASVTVKIRPGQQIQSTQVRAITHLVASSVEGLKPENVVVVETDGTMLSTGNADGGDALAASASDSHRAAELDYAQQIQTKVQSLLDSVLGPNKSVVKASVMMDWTQREVKSENYNPTPAAVLSSQNVKESYTTNGANSGGVPGAGSNLPTPMPTVAAGSGVTNYQRSEETLNYQISKTETHEVVAPGTVKQISLSVLVDGASDANQLASLKSAVMAAAGISAERGDQLVVESMAFDRSYYETQTAEMATAEQTDLYWKIGTGVAAGLAVLLLLWYVMRLFRNLRLASNDTWMTVMKPVTEVSTIGAGAPAAALPMSPGGIPAALMNAQIAAAQAQAQAVQAQAAAAVPEPPSRPILYPEDEQRQMVISKLTEENPAKVAEIIQLWLSQDEKKHG